MSKTKKQPKMVELRYRWNVGRLTIGFVKNVVRDFCFSNGLSFEIIEGSGFLSKPLYIKIYTPENRIGYVERYFEGAFKNDNRTIQLQ